MARSTTRRIWAALVCAAVLSACTTTTGGGDGSEGGEVDRSIVASGTYPIEGLDPHAAEGGAAGKDFVGQAIFSRLTRPSVEGEMVGDLATEWSANDDATEWTFTLREGVLFSDGSELTSEDVVASYQRVLEVDGPTAANFKGTTIEATSPTEVVITAPAGDAAIPNKLAALFILPSGVAAGDRAFFDDPVGSGPFTVASYSAGESIELQANDQHWDGRPEIDTLTIRTIPELSARLTALRTGEIDVVWGIPDDQLAALEQDDQLTVEAVPGNQVFTMWFNSSTPALADAAVRRALWKAVDFETIIEQLYPVTGTLADAPVSPIIFGYAPQEPVVYDPQAAKAELEAAGYNFAQPLRLQFANPQFRPFNQAVVSDLSEIGVNVELLEKEQTVFIEDLLALNWDINFQQLGTAGFDASTNLGRLYPCAAGRNGYCNPELDTLLAAAGATSDEEERQQAYAQASEIIWTDAVGMYPMFVHIAYAWNERVDGFTLDPLGYPDFSKATVADS